MARSASAKIRYAQQIAALPWRLARDGHVDLLLVTSRISRHWLIPKGWPMAGRSPAQAAMQEALEEAGIKGKGAARARPLGRYTYDKILKDGTVIPCSVKVFGMEVVEELPEWPEMDQRERRWFTPAEAADAVTEEGLAEFLRSVELPLSKAGGGKVVA